MELNIQMNTHILYANCKTKFLTSLSYTLNLLHITIIIMFLVLICTKLSNLLFIAKHSDRIKSLVTRFDILGAHILYVLDIIAMKIMLFFSLRHPYFLKSS